MFIFCNQVVLIHLKFLEKNRCQIYIYNVCTALAENKTSFTVIKRSSRNDQNMEIAGEAINIYYFPLFSLGEAIASARLSGVPPMQLENRCLSILLLLLT
jgi:hypothetical protein